MAKSTTYLKGAFKKKKKVFKYAKMLRKRFKIL